ncbi:hypothetical protein BC835DRAFT_1280580 [Cytidiella melzeri]|nr:hypothetical protein BC835DRAFT_1280580 [Cytidiella melzeri]
MLFSKHFRRREAPWEVVDSRLVSPVPMWDEDSEMEVLRMHDTDLLVELQHEIKNVAELRKAVQFARLRLMKEASQLQYNILLMEGWRYTLLRKGSRYRLDVVYSGRPAYATGKIISHSPPPFIGMLDHCRHQMHGFVPAIELAH